MEEKPAEFAQSLNQEKLKQYFQSGTEDKPKRTTQPRHSQPMKTSELEQSLADETRVKKPASAKQRSNSTTNKQAGKIDLTSKSTKPLGKKRASSNADKLSLDRYFSIVQQRGSQQLTPSS